MSIAGVEVRASGGYWHVYADGKAASVSSWRTEADANEAAAKLRGQEIDTAAMDSETQSARRSLSFIGRAIMRCAK